MSLNQKLFNHMRDAHNLTLLQSELETIHRCVVSDDEVVVKKEDLERWLKKIEEAARFRDEAENDIGVVIATISLLINQFKDHPVKLAQKVMMSGGKLNIDEMIDQKSFAQFANKISARSFLEHCEAVAQKYAPLTLERMQQQEQKKLT